MGDITSFMNKPRDFIDADIETMTNKLHISEKIELLSAPDWWNTNGVSRLNIPSLRMSDGPNGVRGKSHFISTPAQCLPCETALASTFDPELVHEVGAFLAEEAKVKSASILLAPTCNIQRSPLGGRAFESFSEDPHLSGTLAAAFVNGLQENGVAATIKHYVANDQEDERLVADSVMSPRALREIYLYPFMLAQKHSKPWAYMTSYGRVDGIHVSESKRFMNDILRKEWGFDGLIMSDWYGTYGTSEALNAGLDLEMPGPPRWRTHTLMSHSLSAGKISFDTLNTRVATVLSFVQRVARACPDVVYGDGEERTADSAERRAFCRRIAAEGIVLLKNSNNILPIRAPLQGKTLKIAVIGPNAKMTAISGGGSAALKPTYVITPLEGIVSNAPPGVEVSYVTGCYSHKFLPTLEGLLTTPSGAPGWTCEFFRHQRGTEIPEEKPLNAVDIYDTRIKLTDFLPAGLGPTWSLELRGTMLPDHTGPFEFGLIVAGRARLYVNGILLIDNWTRQWKGEFWYGQATREETAVINVETGVALDIRVQYITTLAEERHGWDMDRAGTQNAVIKGVRLGGCPKLEPEDAIVEAAELARTSDVVIFVGGLSAEWEAEGADRPSLALPGRQADVIRALARANPRTIVVLQAGSATDMFWSSEVGAIVQAWYLGNEGGAAIADVLFGKVNPTGKLPLTFPERVEHTPAHLSLRSENGRIHYREDLWVGYKHYHARCIKPLFPFGFGLSYTTFSLSNIHVEIDSAATEPGPAFIVQVAVTNTGSVAGSTTVQIYVALPDDGHTHPLMQLRGFAKVKDIVPGDTRTAQIGLDRLAFAYWDEIKDAWKVPARNFVIRAGQHAEDSMLSFPVNVDRTFSWSGL